MEDDCFRHLAVLGYTVWRRKKEKKKLEKEYGEKLGKVE